MTVDGWILAVFTAALWAGGLYGLLRDVLHWCGLARGQRLMHLESLDDLAVAA